MLDANAITALLPPPNNQPLGNAPAVVDSERVTFPTTGEYLNYDAATLPPGQEPTWMPTTVPPTTLPASTPQPGQRTVIDLGNAASGGSSNILWIGVAALVICLLLAGAYMFLNGRRGNAPSTGADPFPY